MTWLVMLLFLSLPLSTARASVPVDVQEVANVSVCKLDQRRTEMRDTLWNDLSRKLLLASMSAGNEPATYEAVRRDVARALADLRRSFGAACVLDIL